MHSCDAQYGTSPSALTLEANGSTEYVRLHMYSSLFAAEVSKHTDSCLPDSMNRYIQRRGAASLLLMCSGALGPHH